MSKRKSAPTLRCKGTNKRGDPCQASIVDADGLCAAHSGKVDMRELGRKGGKGRGGIKPERVHEGLREYLKREVAPERVWAAINQALDGNNESARVSASKLLLDALYEPKRVDEHEHEAVTAAARAKLDEWLPQVVMCVVARLLTTGEAHTTDPMLVHRTLELIEQYGEPSNPRVDVGKSMAPIVERLRVERTAEEEIERRVAELTSGLERERAELAAQRAEFAST